MGPRPPPPAPFFRGFLLPPFPPPRGKAPPPPPPPLRPQTPAICFASFPPPPPSHPAGRSAATLARAGWAAHSLQARRPDRLRLRRQQGARAGILYRRRAREERRRDRHRRRAAVESHPRDLGGGARCGTRRRRRDARYASRREAGQPAARR